MNPAEPNKLSLIKLSLISTGIILLLNAIINILASNFKQEYLSVKFNLDYLIYDISLEGVIVLLCAILTILFTSKLTDFSFKTVIIRLVIMSVIYFLFCLIFEFIFHLVFAVNDFQTPKSITSRFLNFRYCITGMRYSFILMVIWMVLKYRNSNNNFW